MYKRQTQHYHSLKELLEPAHIAVALLTGSVKPGEKKKLYKMCIRDRS